MSTTAVPPGVPKAPQGAIPAIGIPDSVDIPRLVFCAPYYTQVPLAELIAPSVLEATEALLPSLVPPYVTDAANAAVQQQAVLLTGSTMSGPLFLNGLPTQPSQAASMAYVDMLVSTAGVPEVPPVPAGQAWARTTGQWVPESTGSAGVASFNTRIGAVTLTPADVSAASGLLTTGGTMTGAVVLAGVSTAPTAAPGTNTTQIASTAFVESAVASGTAGVASFNSRTGIVTLQAADVSGATGFLTTGGIVTGPTTFSAAGTTLTVNNHAVFGVTGTNNAMTIIPGATAATAVQINQSGTAGFAVAGNLVAVGASIQAQTTLTSGTLGGTGCGLTVQAAAANLRPINFNTGGTPRWTIRANATAEGGANVGSDLEIANFNDAGTQLLTPAIRVTRSTGDTQFFSTVTLAANPTTALQAATKQYVDAGDAAAQHNVGRNLVHNAMFNIAQRGVGPFTTNGVYTLDRWYMMFNGGSMSVSQVALVDADRAAIGDESAEHAIQAVVTGGTGAAAFSQLVHPIEDLYRTSGKTLTVSFWAKAATGTPQIGINFQQFFGAGGSPSAPVNTPGVAVTIAATWARYSVTQAIPSVAGKVMGTLGGACLQLQPWFSSGTTNAGNAGIGVQSGTFQLCGVQLEVGTQATPLEHIDPRTDFDNSLRFYQGNGQIFLGGYGTAGTGVGFSWALPVQMRGTPTLTPNFSGDINISTPALSALSPGFLQATGAITADGGWRLTGTYTASADL